MKKGNRNHWIRCLAVLSFSLFADLCSAATTVSNSSADNNLSPPILLNCGVSSSRPDMGGRNWTGDVGSKFASSLQNTITSRANSQGSSVDEVPYMTARIFPSPFTYRFPVGGGWKFIRLYFYPADYSNFSASNAVFSATAGPYTLLNNFNSSITAEALNFQYLTREFTIYTEHGFLNLTFVPSPNVPNAYAFVNGIEITSIPSIFTSPAQYILNGQYISEFTVDNSTALQTVVRLNVGGSAVSPSKDSPGLFRAWDQDLQYIYAAASGVSYGKDPNITIEYTHFASFIAPLDVYSTARSMGPDPNINKNYNLSWIFTIDANFTYLVRFHFCEIQTPFSKENQRVFYIYINNQTAEAEADVIRWGQGNGVPVYRDYVVRVDGISSQDMWISLHPNIGSGSEYFDAILNGLEVFKLNQSGGNLAGPNPTLTRELFVDPGRANPSASSRIFKGPVIAGGVVGSVAVASLICLAFVVVWHRRKQGKSSTSSDGPSGWLPLPLYNNSHTTGSAKTGTTVSNASSLPSNLCRHFSFAEIKEATNDFSEALILGVGGFGKVFRGKIDGVNKVAIKRANPLSEQGVHEFQTEIEMLSKLRHRHLVSLIGYCEENCEMILVYDYMAHGTLRDHLYRTKNSPLPWKKRLEICMGAARGLHYLHTGANHTIIHRDVKTTNILLDEKWVAKVSDFGLSKTGPMLDQTHVSTIVKGSFGYLDPEYFRRQQLTEKSDVYSFGVVLFEVLCARPALNPALPNEQVSLAEWALHCQKKGVLEEIIDPYLKGKIAPECFRKFAETAEMCLADQGIDRPAMGDVLWNLEFALQLQMSAEESVGIDLNTDNDEVPFTHSDSLRMRDLNALMYFEGNVSHSQSSGITMSKRSLTSEDSDGLAPSKVFSEIMNPRAR